MWKRRDRFEDEMSEELRLHIDEYADELRRTGMPDAEANRRARLAFGNFDTVREDCRQARGLRLLDNLRRELAYAGRLLRKTPGISATALATLAICLGANLTIFAIVQSILIRPLPFPAPDRLTLVFNTYPRAGVPDDGCSITNYYERRGRISAFASLAAYREGSGIIGEPGSTEREWVTQVSPGFFSTLGIQPAIGREFSDDDMSYEAARVVILTDAYWRQHFNADRSVVGRSIRVNGFRHTVVGVLPAGYRFLSSKARLYFPLYSSLEDRGPDRRHSGSSTHMIGRLQPDATLAEAQAQVDAHNAAMERTSPKAKMIADAGFRTIVTPLHGHHVAAIRPALLLTQAGALVLLLIGAVNLANLLLIRLSGRTKELAIRQAIGASRSRVLIELVVETSVLTIIGGMLGVAIGAVGTRLLAVLGARHLPLGAEIAFDVRAAAIGLAAALVIGLTVGAVVAWSSVRAQDSQALHVESRGATASRAAQRLRHGFVVAQIALAFILLSGAGLLAWSLANVMSRSPGFAPEQVLSGHISLPGSNYPQGTSILSFSERLTRSLAATPGVRASGITTNVPLSGNDIKSAARVKGYSLPPGESVHGHYSYGVDGDYFRTMGLSLKEGRYLTADDVQRAARVSVVDEDFARRYWPGGGALGQRLSQGGDEQPDSETFTIVGVVGSVKQADITEDVAQGAIYYPLAHRLDRELYVVIRTGAPPDSFASTLQRVVRRLDQDLPVNDVQSMNTRISESLTPRRSPALLAAIFSGLALLLTAIGTYGVLSYAVSQRRREIGLRMALGAAPAQVRRQFLSLASRMLAAGTALGTAGAWAVGHALQGLLFNVPAIHPATLAATMVVITIVSLAACVLPAHRAARISPTTALAEE
jgi:predicted permease